MSTEQSRKQPACSVGKDGGQLPLSYALKREAAMANQWTLDRFFAGYPESRRIFEALHRAVKSVGAARLRISKSQIALWHTRAFAFAWVPDVYLGGGHAPLVLTLALRRRHPSPRWKQIVEPTPGRFTHHLELCSEKDVDGEVCEWLREAWEAAA